MKLDKRTLGLISLAIIIGGFSLFSYINGGREDLNGNKGHEEMFVDEEAKDVSKSDNKSEISEVFKDNEKAKDNNVDNEEISLKDRSIAVDIKGEVINQGVYYLDEGSIVEDLIKKAGGVTKNASLEFVNRAEKLENNKCVVIPSKEEVKKMKEGNNDNSESGKATLDNNIISGSNNSTVNSGKESNSKENSKININTASLDELDNINGTGPSKAKAIIEYREENGGFKSIEDIKNVSGIGEGTFLKIKESITV